MSKCNFIPGLDADFCKKCHVWIPTDYQIKLLESAVTKSVETLKEWEKSKQKSQKPPKGIMAKIKDTRIELSKALDIKADHTRFASKKEPPIIPPRRPTHVRVFQGYQIDKDNDLELGFTEG